MGRTRLLSNNPLSNAEEQVEEIREKTAELKNKIESSRLSKAEIEDFKVYFEEINSHIFSANCEINDAVSEREDLESEISNLESEIKDLEEEKNRFKSNLNDEMKFAILEQVFKKYSLQQIQRWFPEFAGLAYEGKL